MSRNNHTLPIQTRAAAGELGAHREAPRAAVLLVNLGTPAAPAPRALRQYLREFLWDPRVVEIPRPLWWLILHGIIVPFRAPRSARAYARIWTEHGSPLMVHSRQLSGRLQAELGRRCPRVRVALAMRYGAPGIGEVLSRLADDNVQRLLVLPLYPQYSATTTASVFDRVTQELARMRWLPELRFINQYHRDEGWQAAIADSVRGFQQDHGRPDKLLFSFHGIPRRNLLLGDPYHCQCLVSARRIAQRLGLSDEAWQFSFQSRLGRAEWLRPYTDETLAGLARKGVKSVQVVCPGFAVDCLETLEEIAMENRDHFIAAGGERLDYIPALNAGDTHARLLANLCLQHGQGWPEFQGMVADGTDAIRDRLARVDARAGDMGLR